MVVLALLVAPGCKPEASPPPPIVIDGFVRTWGEFNDDLAGTLGLLDDGGLLVGLELANPARTDAYLTRLDPSGAERWKTRWARENDEELHATLVSGDVGRVGGAIWDGADSDADVRAFLLDVDLESGELQGNPAWEWNATSGRDAVQGLLPVGADTLAVGWGGADILLARLDADGTPLDEGLWDGGEREEVEHAVVAGDLVVVTGRSADDLEQDDFGNLLVAAFHSADLTEAWRVEWGEAFRSEHVGWGVASSDDLAVVAGGTGDGDAVVLGLDLAGTLLWELVWDSGDVDVGRSVVLEGATALVAIDAGSDVAFVRVDLATGDVVDEGTFGGAGVERVRQLVVSDDRGCMAGSVTGGPDGADQALVACFERDPLVFPEAP